MKTGMVLVDEGIYNEYIQARKACREFNGKFKIEGATSLHLKLFYSGHPVEPDRAIQVPHPLMLKPH